MQTKISIIMLSSKGCFRCEVVEQRILMAAKRANIKVDIEKIDSSLPRAIDLGIKYGLEDIPSVVVAGCTAFSGDSFTDDQLYKAIADAEAKRKKNAKP